MNINGNELDHVWRPNWRHQTSLKKLTWNSEGGSSKRMWIRLISILRLLTIPKSILEENISFAGSSLPVFAFSLNLHSHCSSFTPIWTRCTTYRSSNWFKSRILACTFAFSAMSSSNGRSRVVRTRTVTKEHFWVWEANNKREKERKRKRGRENKQRGRRES